MAQFQIILTPKTEEDMSVTDTDLLNALESLPVPPGYGWQVRESSTGRGWRLLTTSATPAYATVRGAIEAFVRERGKETQDALR